MIWSRLSRQVETSDTIEPPCGKREGKKELRAPRFEWLGAARPTPPEQLGKLCPGRNISRGELLRRPWVLFSKEVEDLAFLKDLQAGLNHSTRSTGCHRDARARGATCIHCYHIRANTTATY
jgi:hypothetical protein